MLRSIRIQNFRGIKEADIPRLKRVNLVSGRNGGGKTSLLEAAFLNAGGANASLLLNLSAFRGDPIPQAESDRVFRSCFYDMEESRHIHIQAQEMRHLRARSRLLTIEAQTQTRPVPGRSPRKTFVSGARFRFRGPSGEAVSDVSLLFPRPGESIANPVQLTSAENKDAILARFLSPYFREVYKETHDDLVKSVKEKNIDEIIDAVSIVQNGIHGITPLTEGAQPNIYVDIGRANLLPVAALGSGFFHILRLSLSLAQMDRGIILVDELEDGLHFSIIPKIARLIYSVVRSKRNVQIFISTHSAELIETFLNVAKELSFEELCLINMSPSRGGVETKYFDKGELQYALELDAELR